MVLWDIPVPQAETSLALLGRHKQLQRHQNTPNPQPAGLGHPQCHPKGLLSHRDTWDGNSKGKEVSGTGTVHSLHGNGNGFVTLTPSLSQGGERWNRDKNKVDLN